MKKNVLIVVIDGENLKFLFFDSKNMFYHYGLGSIFHCVILQLYF